MKLRALLLPPIFLFTLCVLLLSACGGGGGGGGGDASSSESVVQESQAPIATIASIDTNPDDEITTITGNASANEEVTTIELSIHSKDTAEYWNGQGYQGQPTFVLATVENTAVGATWEYRYKSGRDGNFTVAASAIGISGDEQNDPSEHEFRIALGGSPENRFENVPLVTGVTATREDPATGQVECINILCFTQQKIASTPNLWPLYSKLKVGFRFDDNGNNPFGLTISARDRFNTRDFGYICNALDADATCYSRVQTSVLNWANEWSKYGSAEFTFSSWADADIRVTFNDECYSVSEYANCGSYSRLGVQSRSATDGSMNFDWLDAEVVVHEFGHALGFEHEQLRPDRPFIFNSEKVVQYWANLGHSRPAAEALAETNVLAQLDFQQDAYLRTIGDYDAASIMQYEVPIEWVDNKADCPDYPSNPFYCVTRNTVLSDKDKIGMGELYPTLAFFEDQVKNGDAAWVEYSNLLDISGNLSLYFKVPETLRQDASARRATIRIIVTHTNSDLSSYGCGFLNLSTCFRATTDTYRGELKYAPLSGPEYRIGYLDFSVRGNKDLGSGFQTNGPHLCSTQACVGQAARESVQFLIYD